jgi:lysophospholipase L1-like esterase
MKSLLLFLLLLSFSINNLTLSQCSEVEQDKVLLVGDSWAFFMGVDQTINDVFTQWGHSDKKFYTNLTLAENGAETVDFLQQGKQDEIEQQLDNRPEIDIVHLSIGGNDVLGSWNTNMTQQQTDSIKNEVKDSIIAVIDFIQSVRPGIQVVWSGYCYSNFEEVIEGQLIPSAHPFYGTWSDMNFPDNETINTVLNEFTNLMYSVYENDPNVHVIKATAMMQRTFGQIDPLDVAPFGTYPIETAPMTEGFVDYPSPKPSMRNYGITKDCFHLSIAGYEDLISYHTQKYYHKALMHDKHFLAVNGPSTGSVSSNGTIDTLLKLGDDGVEQYETLLTFDTKGELDSIVESASLFLFRKGQVGTNPIDGNLVIKIVNGNFGANLMVEIDDYGINGSYLGTPCVFGDNQDGRWVRLDLPGQLLPFINGAQNTQIKLSTEEGNGAFIELGDASDSEFSPVLDITYGNQSVVSVTSNDMSDIMVYPNPAKDIIRVDGGSFEVLNVSVYNLLGDLVIDSSYFLNGQIKINSLSKGTYFLKIQTEMGIESRKFIKY